MHKIMVVEDDLKIAEFLLSTIMKYGYDGIRVNDFQHALDEFHQAKPDMVLLDVNLTSSLSDSSILDM